MNTPIGLTMHRLPAVKARGPFRFVIGIILLLGAACLLSAGERTAQQPSFPEIFVVNSTGDGDDAFHGDGQCETVVGNGVCTLRAAIEEANAHAGGDGIGFSIPTTDPGYSNGRWTISLTTALPNISDSVNISGPGASSLTVLRNLNSGAFRVFNVTTTGTLNLSGLTISNGIANGSGGGIQNASTGTVNVSNCLITNNHGIDGGGVANATTGSISLTNCTLDSNSTQLSNGDSHGGGIYNPSGTVTLTSCTVSSNTVYGGQFHGYGGGVYNTGLLLVTGSAILNNTVQGKDEGFGGGIYNDGSLEVTNSTIYNNIATSDPLQGCSPGFECRAGVGAGIYNLGTGIITNNTIAYNSSAGGGQNFDAGGIQTDTTASHMQVKSCIIAKNVGSGPDVSGAFTSGGFNLIGAVDSSTGFTAATDQTGTEAFPLDPEFDDQLGDNGGPTRTLALLCGSPAIDKGTSNGLTGTLTTDQRGTGFARTVDDAAVSNAPGGDGTDIGAFEYGAGSVIPTSVVSRKFHGTGSPPPHFDIPLPLSCTSMGIECRRNTGTDTVGANVGHDHELIVTFGSNVTVASAEVVNVVDSFPVGSATVSASNNIATVDLHGIPNPARLSVNLRGVSDGTHSGLVSIPMGVLLGDVNSSHRTDSGDVAAVRNHVVSVPTDDATARFDVNLSDRIDSGDVTATRSASITTLP
jgi:CSLREA domain-containing protein